MNKKLKIIFTFAFIAICIYVQSDKISAHDLNDNNTSYEIVEKNKFFNVYNDDKSNSGFGKIEFESLDEQIVEINDLGEVKPAAVVNSFYSIRNSNDSSLVKISNGQIISATNSIFITVGGKEKILQMYNTLEDASSNINGIPIDGAGYDGTYYETVEFNGVNYARILISGFEGYMKLEDIQIIPASLIKARSHFAIKGDQWVQYIAVDPLLSDKYTELPFSEIPEWAETGVKYYSDDSNFYKTSKTANNSDVSAIHDTFSLVNYYKNLPIRSSSNYSAEQYKYYLELKGRTNSKFYNSTSSFVEAQKLEYVNSLFLFAFAIHEGNYGTSTYSNRCNNFYGRGAFDSNPDNACIEYGYNTPRDGILAQAIFLQNNYLDIDEWVYNGGYIGDKSGGMNVKYATDANWGNAIASHMDQINTTLGNKENNKYRVASVARGTVAYNDPARNSPVMTDKNVAYDMTTQSLGEVNVIVTGVSGSSSQVVLDTPKNIQGSNYISRTFSRKGSYPNYDNVGGRGYVENGRTSYLASYSSWNAQKVWVPTSSLRILNNVPPVDLQDNVDITRCAPMDPIQNGTISSFSYDGLKKCSVTYVNSKVVKDQSEIFSTSGVLINLIIDHYNESNQRITTINAVYNEGGQVSDSTTNFYPGTTSIKRFVKDEYTNAKRTKTVVQEYDTSGLKYTNKITNFNSNGNIVATQEFAFSNGVVKSNVRTNFSDDGQKNYEATDTYSSNIIVKTIANIYNPDGSINYIDETTYNKDNGVINGKVVKMYVNDIVDRVGKYWYDNAGKVTINQTDGLYTDGSVRSIQVDRYDGDWYYKVSNESYSQDGKMTLSTSVTFDRNKLKTGDITDTLVNGKRTGSFRRDFVNGTDVSVDNTLELNENGKLIFQTINWYENNNRIKTVTNKMYDNGYVDTQKIFYYSDDGLILIKEYTEKRRDNNSVAFLDATYFDLNSKKTKYVYDRYDMSKRVYTINTFYDSNEIKIRDEEYHLYSNFVTKTLITTHYNLSGEVTLTNIKNYNSNGVLISESNE